MSLRGYMWPRLVVLSSTSSALEAARALENNHIGAVLVQEGGEVVGIVTDRDLALRVIGGRMELTTPLSRVMTHGLATLPPDASRADALRLMRERRVRRIPIVEGGQLAGIVTLDDLLLDESMPVEQLAEAVRAQVGAGGPADLRHSRAEERRNARAEATYGRFLHELRARTGLDSAERAETALDLVLSSLLRRLTAGEAEDLIAQLPSLLQPALRALPPGPDKLITRSTIEADLVRRLDVDPARATRILDAVGATLEANVSAGQIEDVRHQLPAELRSAFPQAAP